MPHYLGSGSISNIARLSELLDHLRHCLNDVFDVLIAHPGIEWQRYEALVLLVGHWEVVRFIAVSVSVVRMQVNGDKMHARADVAGFEFLDKLTATDLQSFWMQPENVEMPGGFDF